MNYKKIFINPVKTTATRAYDKATLYQALRKNMKMPASRAYAIAKQC